MNFSKADLNETDNYLCELAWQLTRTPNISTEPIIGSLKDKGLDDRAILDATLAIGYFNFVNRIVLGLGVELKKEEQSGYKY